ncbi:unnamed protein product [Blepharisma stoltei]|uniref:Protein kinase domain-containing protein n=1 Tax=Blepharisma stoltei TaxID=1481888 RepID=A0AAU9J935_9CILI|nr:unnamed protein product [Blepharisma stoltei]
MNTDRFICKKCYHYALFQTNFKDFFCHKHSKDLCEVSTQNVLERIKHSVNQKSKEIIKNFIINAISCIERVLELINNLPEGDYNKDDKNSIENCINKLKALLEKCSKTDFVEAKAFYLPLEYFLIRLSDDAYKFTENVFVPDLNEDISYQAEMWLKFTDYIFNCNYFKILDYEWTWAYYHSSFKRLNDLLWVGLYQATEYLLIYEYESAQQCMESCKEICKEISFPHQIDEYIIEAFLLVIKLDQIYKSPKFSKGLQKVENKIISAGKMTKLKMFYHIFMNIFLYLNDLQSSKMYARKLLNHFDSIEAYLLLSNIYVSNLDLKKSRKYLKKAYLLIKKYMKKSFLTKAIILQELGIISIYQNQKEKAAKYFKVAIRHLREVKSNNQLIAFQKQYYLAKILLLQSDFKESFDIFYKEIFHFFKKPNKWISAELIKYHQEYVWLFYSMDLISEARSEILKNIKIWIDMFLRWNHPILFWVYLLSSAIAFRSGLWDECRTYLKSAKKIIKSNRFHNIKFLRTLIDEHLGFLYIKINDLDRAEKLLKRCIQSYEAPECHPIVDLFWLTYSLNGINLKKQNFIKSFEYLLKAQKFWDSKHKLKSHSCEIQIKLPWLSTFQNEQFAKQFKDLYTVEKKILEKGEYHLAHPEFDLQSFSKNIENEYNFLHRLGNLSEHFVKYYKLAHIGDEMICIRDQIKGNLYEEIIERSKNGIYWTEKELIAMASFLSESLAILHENYIYHGNLDPSSILISLNGEWKIGNFLEAKQFWIYSSTNKILEFDKNDWVDLSSENSKDDNLRLKTKIPIERKEVYLLGKIIWMAASLKSFDPTTFILDTTIKEKYSRDFQKFIDLMLLRLSDNLYWPYMRDINLKARNLLKISTPENYLIDLELQRLNLILKERNFH